MAERTRQRRGCPAQNSFRHLYKGWWRDFCRATFPLCQAMLWLHLSWESLSAVHNCPAWDFILPSCGPSEHPVHTPPARYCFSHPSLSAGITPTRASSPTCGADEGARRPRGRFMVIRNSFHVCEGSTGPAPFPHPLSLPDLGQCLVLCLCGAWHAVAQISHQRPQSQGSQL